MSLLARVAPRFPVAMDGGHALVSLPLAAVRRAVENEAGCLSDLSLWHL
jgi:hypothetical protein